MILESKAMLKKLNDLIDKEIGTAHTMESIGCVQPAEYGLFRLDMRGVYREEYRRYSNAPACVAGCAAYTLLGARVHFTNVANYYCKNWVAKDYDGNWEPTWQESTIEGVGAVIILILNCKETGQTEEFLIAPKAQFQSTINKKSTVNSFHGSDGADFNWLK